MKKDFTSGVKFSYRVSYWVLEKEVEAKDSLGVVEMRGVPFKLDSAGNIEKIKGQVSMIAKKDKKLDKIPVIELISFTEMN